MIRSMTAFARASASSREGGWVVEIRSVNHRYFEFSFKLPPSLFPLESRIRDFVQKDIRRGKITLAISQDGEEETAKPVTIDESVVKMYLQSIHKLKKKFRLQGDLSVRDLLGLPRIFTVEKSEENPEKSWRLVQKTLRRTLALAIKAKEGEGAKLAEDVLARLGKIKKTVQKIESLASGMAEKYFKKLSERVDQLLAEKEKDPERIHREVAFLAERTDITEEIVRMKSHLEQFERRLKSETEVGRELDFMCQEMNREVNTMGSKAQLFEISTEVVFMKGELEKIREQIQNIE